MDQVSIIGLDIAKSVFQAHGADASGGVVFRKKIARAKLLEFFASQPLCLVAMEACGGAHHWAREIGKLGHEVKLIAPKYVKPSCLSSPRPQWDWTRRYPSSTRRSPAALEKMRSHGVS